MEKFLEYLVKSIVNHSDQVMIERNMNSYDETYILHVAAEDMGVIIGKQGKNIMAIRNLASIKAVPNRVYIQLAEQLA
jgi:predicted RNA-binding protein YlqC (UPF0109 family)